MAKKATNPFEEYQKQFLEFWSKQMPQVPGVEAYKTYYESILELPGMEMFKPFIENIPEFPGLDVYKSFYENMQNFNPMDAYKSFFEMGSGFNPMEAYQSFFQSKPAFDPMKAYKTFTDNMSKFDPVAAAKDFAGSVQEFKPTEAYESAVEFYKSLYESTQEAFKNFKPADAYQAGVDAFQAFIKESQKSNPVSAYASYVEGLPGADAYKKFLEGVPGMDQAQSFYEGLLPSMNEYWKAFNANIPGIDQYWKSVSTMMPDANSFMNSWPVEIPGLDTTAKLFELWQSMQAPITNPFEYTREFQDKYVDIMQDIIKNYLPEGAMEYLERPMEFMDTLVSYYRQNFEPLMQIDDEVLQRIATGDLGAYTDFFRSFNDKYEETIGKYYNMMGLGLNRESNEDVLKAMSAYNKTMFATGEMLSMVMTTGAESSQKLMEAFQNSVKDGVTPTTFLEFYKLWSKTAEDELENLFGTDEFAKTFDNFADMYSQYMAASNKVTERALAALPIPTNKDMKSLYKTVYDLRKEVRDLKRELASLKDAAPKDAAPKEAAAPKAKKPATKAKK